MLHVKRAKLYKLSIAARGTSIWASADGGRHDRDSAAVAASAAHQVDAFFAM